MATNKELEKRIENLEKEVQHLKAVLQYQMRNRKNWIIMYEIAITYGVVSLLLMCGFAYLTCKMTSKKWNTYYLHRYIKYDW